MSVLNVNEKVRSDNRLTSKQYHNHIPFGSPKYGNNDEIRIVIPEIDKYTLPSESYLCVDGKLHVAGDENNTSQTASLISNAVAFMFSDIRYIMNGIEVDSVRNPGISTTMKGYFSFSPGDVNKLENAGWNIKTWKVPNIDIKGNFSICVPLKTLLGFAEDFKHIVMHVTQELLLVRSNDDKDAIIQSNKAEEVKIAIERVIWRVPHVTVGLRDDLSLTKMTNKNVLMEMSFRGWELHEYPSVTQTTKHNWSIKTAPNLETPRYIILGFQTAKRGVWDMNMSQFDFISLTNVTLYLNGARYPYENMNIDFNANRFASLYDTYAGFQNSYYGFQDSQPLFDLTHFKLCPLVGIDCTYQQEAIHKSSIEIRLEFSTKENVPAETTAYCLILHNKLFEYSPYNKIVQRKY